MASIAAQRSATGGFREAFARTRTAIRTETGAMICMFLLLRLIATAHMPHAYPDTPTYETLNFLGDATRLWTVPLVWNLTPGADLHVVAQIVLGMVAWSVLAVSVSGAIADRWVRRVATACVLMLGLVVQVTSWDSTLLSESITASLLVLETALLIWLVRGPTPQLIAACVAVAALWMFSRQVNVLLYLICLPFVVGFAFLWLPRRTAALSAVIVLVLGAWGVFAITRDGPAATRVWQSNALDIIVDKIADDPGALQYFIAHGLPQTPEVMRERGNFQGVYSPLFQDRRFMQWVQDHFRQTYLGYLLRHPRHAFWEPIVQIPVLGSAAQPLGKATAVLPEPVASTLWSTSEGDIPFWAVVALALMLVGRARGVRSGLLVLSALLVASSIPLAIISYDTGGLYPFRYYIPVGLLVRLGLLLSIAVSIDGLITSRRRDAAAPANA